MLKSSAPHTAFPTPQMTAAGARSLFHFPAPAPATCPLVQFYTSSPKTVPFPYFRPASFLSPSCYSPRMICAFKSRASRHSKGFFSLSPGLPVFPPWLSIATSAELISRVTPRKHASRHLINRYAPATPPRGTSSPLSLRRRKNFAPKTLSIAPLCNIPASVSPVPRTGLGHHPSLLPWSHNWSILAPREPLWGLGHFTPSRSDNPFPTTMRTSAWAVVNQNLNGGWAKP